MITTMPGSLTGAAADVLWWALAKAPLALAGAALTAWLLRGASAATRHRVWATAVMVTLALPLLSLLVPRVGVILPVRAHDAPAQAVVASGTAHATAVHEAHAVVRPTPAAHAAPAARAPRAAAERGIRQAPPSAHPVVAGSPARVTQVAGMAPPPARVDSSFGGLVLLIWAVVATGLLVRLLVDRLRTRRMESAYRDVSEAPLGRAVRMVAADDGVRAVRVLLGAPDAMPVTWGSRRPVLLLPEGADAWSARRLYAVVRHELAHVGRGDVRVQLLADLLCALHWFDPLAWYAAHRMRIEREHACDDEVLAAGARPSEYASELVGLARRFREPRVAGVAMARRSGLRTRVECVLDERRPRGESPFARRGIRAAAVLLALPLAAFAPRPAAESPSAVVAAGPRAPGPSPVHAVLPAPPVAAPAPRAQLATLCWEDTRNGSTNVRRNDDRFELEWKRDDCSADITVDGTLRFNDDFTRIVALSSGGRVRFTERDGRRERRVEIRPAGGGIERTWWVDGDERPFDAEAEAWLDAMLLNAFRSGGLATEERAAWMLRARGVDAVLDELAYVRSDWVRGIYLMTAIGSPELDDARAVRLIEEGAATIGSDHTLMEVLQTVAQRRSLTDAPLRAAFIDAAGTIESDHARARVLETALTGRDLPERDLAAILDAVAGIGSDHEKSELLVMTAERHTLTPALRAAYLRVTAAIDSDHATGRAAHALLDAGSPSAEELELALDVAQEIDSDHEIGELMRRLASVDLADADVRRRYEAALAGIGSDHTIGVVLMGLMENGDMDAVTASVVLRGARSIGSDHTLGEVLTMLVRQGGVTEDTRAAFDAALDSIGSDHTRAQVERSLRGR